MHFKRACIFIAALMLCGCSSASDGDGSQAFSISEEKESSYSAQIESAMNSFYWRYDSDSLSYDSGTVPEDEYSLECSARSGYNLASEKGHDCIVATADLLYFNREIAGTVYFYFTGNDLAGLYYIPSGSDEPCSMHVRNAYLVSSPFTSAETDAEEAEYTVKSTSRISSEGIFDTVTLDGVSYCILTDGISLTITEGASESYFRTRKEIDFSRDGLLPVSAVFINGTTEMAVLYGVETYSEEGAVPITVPQKIVFFDSDFNITESEIITDGSDVYSVGYDSGCLLVARSRSIDSYPLTGTAAGAKEASYYVGKSVTGMKITDLDGDGETEFIFTDGMDIFIFHRVNSVFKCVWSTHLSIESFEKYIYTGDLNHDGIEEIYVFDSTGTTSKYEIGENGLYTSNENIDYGQRYHVADFNGDGADDCLIISGADVNTQELRIFNG